MQPHFLMDAEITRPDWILATARRSGWAALEFAPHRRWREAPARRAANHRRTTGTGGLALTPDDFSAGMARTVLSPRGPMLKLIVNTLSKRFLCGLVIGWASLSMCLAQAVPEKLIREVIAAAVAAATPAEHREIVLALKLKPFPEAVIWFEKWKAGEIFLNEDSAGVVTPVTLSRAARSRAMERGLRDAKFPEMSENTARSRCNPLFLFSRTITGSGAGLSESAATLNLPWCEIISRILERKSSESWPGICFPPNVLTRL